MGTASGRVSSSAREQVVHALMAKRRNPQTAAKRAREQAMREKRERKQAKKQARADTTAPDPPDPPTDPDR